MKINWKEGYLYTFSNSKDGMKMEAVYIDGKIVFSSRLGGLDMSTVEMFEKLLDEGWMLEDVEKMRMW